MRAVQSVNLACAVLMFLNFTSFSLGQEHRERHPVPPVEERQKAIELLREVYKVEYDGAVTAASKSALAKKLLKAGIVTQENPAAQFALLRIAKDIAAAGGDVDIAMEAASAIGTFFEVQELDYITETLVASAKLIRSRGGHQRILDHAIPNLAAAIKADQYDVAKQLVEVALSSARATEDASAIDLLRTKAGEVATLAEHHGRLSVELKKLETNPNDPRANYAVGRFQCFIKGNWTDGLALLAFGTDEVLSELAVRELKGRTSSLELGDSWWNVAEREEGLAAKNIQRHAAGFYRKSIPLASGLERAKAEKRLAQIESQLQSLVLVDDGRIKVVANSPDWVGGSGFIEGSQRLTFSEKLGRGDFRLELVMSLQRIEGTATAVFLRCDGRELRFGLDGRGKRMFVEGELFGPTEGLAPTEDHIKRSVPFLFTVERSADIVSFSINNQLVRRVRLSVLDVDRFGITPHRGRVRLFKASVTR